MASQLPRMAGGCWGGHRGSPHVSVTYFENHKADTSQETKRLPEPTVSCLMLDNMPTSPRRDGYGALCRSPPS